MAAEPGSDYVPSPDEDYMNDRQLAYFRNKLIAWRESLLEEAQGTLEGLRDSAHHEVGDDVDRATREADQALELRTRDRCRKLVIKIDQALARIEDGSYGYCEETGEPIGLARLEARPVATLSVEAQERREIKERQQLNAY
ncbi:MAG: RNA polymerase-binding protein DksA [Sphingobacteriia bacterium]|nr:RNA polymerase-binding protein DksA [Sphingobacteriia bacterium]NCC38495.1 RNA polymerase-binding protein DksA [Gammaproteobacteria bacterium]